MLRTLTPTEHPDLIVGAVTGDDAAVWRLDKSRALVFTTDFITPLVDSARDWGRIAAANAVSDVYAMGGRPMLALNLVAWSRDELPTDLLVEVLAGAEEIASEAGFVTVGGHTVDDPAPKFGLAVIGEADPQRLLTNTGLRPGDMLVLTKPLGVGVISTAIKQQEASTEVVAAAVDSMTRLNREASEIALEMGATGATDVTGFGLLGHLGRMAIESGVDVTIGTDTVPLLPGARQLAEAGMIPGGSRRNLEWVSPRLDPGDTDPVMVLLMADAQTSGGLLFGVAHDRAAEAVERLRSGGHDAALIGGVTGAGEGHIRLG